MIRQKIDYGIDLGTTNSAIARMDNGEPVVKKTSLPSAVYFSKNRKEQLITQVGQPALNSLKNDRLIALVNSIKGVNSAEHGYMEFKRDMGTDKTFSNENMTKDCYSAEELSSLVLSELGKIVNDEKLTAAVITVPAKFTAPQKEATMKAAELAGITDCHLLQEPVAACYAFGNLVKEKNGWWMVFDFGGGTFDAAMVNSYKGVLSVVDTEGDNYLGGKNLDNEVVNQILMPHLKEEFNLSSFDGQTSVKGKCLRQVLKNIAEEIRKELSYTDSYYYSSYDRNINLCEDDDGNPIEIDITVTSEDLEKVLSPVYQKAVDICKVLLQRNNKDGYDLEKLILIGGPTISPIVRNMLKQQITKNIDTSIDPMTAVARGAALYASTINRKFTDTEESGISDDTVVLDVSFEETSVNQNEFITINLNMDKSGDTCPEALKISLKRTDGAWQSDNVSVGTMPEIFDVSLIQRKANVFTIEAYDLKGNKISTYPDTITITQGTKLKSPPNPYNFAIGVIQPEQKIMIIKKIAGLEKNAVLPASGTLSGSSTNKDIVKGNPDTNIPIPVYQVDDLSRICSKKAKYYERIGLVKISGADREINQNIPKGTPLEVTIFVDSSELITVRAFFPTLDIAIDKKLQMYVQSIADIREDYKEFSEILQNIIEKMELAGKPVSKLKQTLITAKNEALADDYKAALQHLKEELRLADL